MDSPEWTLGSDGIYHNGRLCSELFLVAVLNDQSTEIKATREVVEAARDMSVPYLQGFTSSLTFYEGVEKVCAALAALQPKEAPHA